MKKILKISLPLILGIIIFYLLYSSDNFKWKELMLLLKQGINYKILLLSLLFGLLANGVRGIRWHLLNHEVASESKPKLYHSLLCTYGNYAVNMAFPRMGEVWRCAAMAHYSGIPFAKLLGTLLIDRASDFVAIGLILGSILLFRFDFIIDFFSRIGIGRSATGPMSLLSSPWFIIAVLLGIAVLYLLYRLTKHLSFVKKIIGFVQNVFNALGTVAKMKKKWLFWLYTFLLWLGYFLFFYITFFAFSFTKDLGIMNGLLAFTMSSIAVAAPVQAGMGAWHFMVITTLTAFAVSKEDAYNFALVVHTIQTVFTTLVGLIAIFILQFTGRSKQAMPDIMEAEAMAEQIEQQAP